MKIKNIVREGTYPFTTTRTIEVPQEKVIVTIINGVFVTVEVIQEVIFKKQVLRPWKANEVPLGAKFKSYGGIQNIVGYNPRYSCIFSPAILLDGGKFRGHDDHYFITDLVTSLSEPMYSWDGVNWERCGVWVDVK